MLGAREDQRAVHRLAFEDLRKQRRLRAAVHLDDALGHALGGGGHRRHRDPLRIAQHVLGEFGDRLRHRRREEQRLPLGRQLGDDLADVVDEAHVEHAIGFIEHEKLDLIELQRIAAHQIEQTARRCDHDVDAAHHRANLAAHRHAADRQRGAQPEVPAIGVEAVEDLSGQFARRAEARARGSSSARSASAGGSADAGSAARRPRSCRCRSGQCRRRRVRSLRAEWSGPGLGWE